MKLNEILKESVGKFLTDHAEIEAWLGEMNIINYTINVNGVVDVNKHVNLSDRRLSRIPIQFGKVVGYFSCSNNLLTSLAGCPTHVGQSFYCNRNELTSLEDLPTQIGAGFWCISNKISSRAIGLILTGCTELEADGDWVKIINKYLGRPDDIFECQAELIENGFEDHAIL